MFVQFACTMLFLVSVFVWHHNLVVWCVRSTSYFGNKKNGRLHKIHTQCVLEDLVHLSLDTLSRPLPNSIAQCCVFCVCLCLCLSGVTILFVDVLCVVIQCVG